jgi:predicted nucleic acid-binding protein
LNHSQQAVRDVKQLAQTHQLTAYDAAYLALALRFQLPHATLDQELITAAHAAGVKLIQ